MIFVNTPEELQKKEDRKKARAARLEQKKRLIEEVQKEVAAAQTPLPWSLTHFHQLVKGAFIHPRGSVSWAMAVLGVEPPFCGQKAKSNYIQWHKSFHPDRANIANVPLFEAQEAASILNEAWDVIKKTF